ncbi:hypothetical protein ABT344_31535, partial [Micromonospora carbonacea]|uniref:hypothetical protein n=1 Tax=Micromonospora carbonacea TaxID=47853 RepID=UPI00332A0863
MPSTGFATDFGPLALAALHTTSEVTAIGGMTVTRYSGDRYWTMSRVIVPANPGDVLDMDARCRVTNPLPYSVGMTARFWAYDLDDGQPSPTRPWWEIGRLTGDNVTASPQRHHMPMCLHDVYQVPTTWVPGHRMVVVMRTECHSDAVRTGDRITVDDYGVLTVRRWVAPAVEP